jgi:hypothetical protein
MTQELHPKNVNELIHEERLELAESEFEGGTIISEFLISRAVSITGTNGAQPETSGAHSRAQRGQV